MKSVGLRCSNLSKYHNVYNGMKRSNNHERPTVLYRVLYAVFYLLTNYFHFFNEIVCRIKKNVYICIRLITIKKYNNDNFSKYNRKQRKSKSLKSS